MEYPSQQEFGETNMSSSSFCQGERMKDFFSIVSITIPQMCTVAQEAKKFRNRIGYYRDMRIRREETETIETITYNNLTPHTSVNLRDAFEMPSR